MDAISVTDAGLRRTIAQGRRLIPDEAISASFPGQDHAALLIQLPNARTSPALQLDVITIPGGYLRFGPSVDGVVATAEGRPVFETLMFAQGYEHPSLETLRTTACDIDEDWVTVIDCAWHNHFHLLTLAIPKLRFARARLPEATVALPARRVPSVDGKPAMLDQLLALTGDTDGVRFAEDGLYRVRNLHIVWQNLTQPAYLHLIDETYAVFSDMTRRVAREDGTRFPRRFFIERVRESRLLDPRAERHLRRHLKRHGFATIRLEQYRIEDQIRLFSGATHVVAAHGAGLSNIVFAAPSLRILELNLELDGPGILRPWFLILASGMRQHYQYLNGTACQLDDIVMGLAFDRLMQVRGQKLRYRLALHRARAQALVARLRALVTSA